MTIPEENPTDDELASLMNDSENLNASEEGTAGVEAGIPPEVVSKDGAASDEETFSMDDFDEEMTTAPSEGNNEPETVLPVGNQVETVADGPPPRESLVVLINQKNLLLHHLLLPQLSKMDQGMFLNFEKACRIYPGSLRLINLHSYINLWLTKERIFLV